MTYPTKTYYQYSATTGIYLDPVENSVDPLATAASGRAVYPVLANATPLIPPKEQGKAAVFGDHGWQLVADYRGQTVYRTTDKQPMTITELGDLPAGYTLLVPGQFDSWNDTEWATDIFDELNHLKMLKLKELIQSANKALAILTDGYPELEVLSWDKQDREARAWLADSSSETPLLDGITHNRGIEKSLLIDKVIDKSNFAANYTGQILGKRQALEDQVDAATDKNQLDALVW